MHLAYLLAASAVLALGCSGTKSANTDTGKAAAAAKFSMVQLRQSGCFGTCPVYTLEVLPTGEATYTGKRYAPYKGAHTAQLDADSLAVLTTHVQRVLAKADELPREIETQIADLATSTIVIVDGADTLTFRGTSEFAAPVADLRQTLFSVAEHNNWQRSPDAEPLPPNQLLLTLKAADQIQVVTENYYRQQMKMERLVKQSPPTFLVSFDPYTMSAEEMVRDLKRNKMVVRAEIVEHQ